MAYVTSRGVDFKVSLTVRDEDEAMLTIIVENNYNDPIYINGVENALIPGLEISKAKYVTPIGNYFSIDRTLAPDSQLILNEIFYKIKNPKGLKKLDKKHKLYLTYMKPNGEREIIETTLIIEDPLEIISKNMPDHYDRITGQFKRANQNASKKEIDECSKKIFIESSLSKSIVKIGEKIRFQLKIRNECRFPIVLKRFSFPLYYVAISNSYIVYKGLRVTFRPINNLVSFDSDIEIAYKEDFIVDLAIEPIIQGKLELYGDVVIEILGVEKAIPYPFVSIEVIE